MKSDEKKDPNDVRWAEEIAVLGTTSVSPRGYSAKVSVVRYPTQGMRVRLALLRFGEMLRFFDLTPAVFEEVKRILNQVDLRTFTETDGNYRKR